MRKTREEVLRDIDVTRIVSQLGLQTKGADGVWLNCLCPFHEDTEPSFRIALEETPRSNGGGVHEKGFWTCLASCGNGSLYDLVIRIRGGDFKSARDYLGGERTSSSTSSPSRLRKLPSTSPPVDDNTLSAMQAYLLQDEQAMKWLTDERGLSKHVLSLVGLGLRRTKRGRFLVIPGYQGVGRDRSLDHLKYVRIGPDRHVDDKANFYNTKGANPKLVFPQGVSTGDGPILVVESELDALLLISHGYRAIATRGTANMRGPQVAPYAKLGEILLWADNDDAGHTALESCGHDLQMEGINFKIVSLMRDGCKDVGEVWSDLRDAGEFKAFVEEAIKTATSVDGLTNAEVWKNLQTYHDKEGNLVVCRTIRNLDMILMLHDSWGESLWMNEMGKVRMLDEIPLRDDDLSDMQAEIEDTYTLTMPLELITQRVRSLCRKQAVHPVREWLEDLDWDGEERIAHIFGDLIALGPNQDRKLKTTYLRKWLIGAIARVMEPGCKMDTMLVLYSAKQGIGKSMWVETMAIEPEWFSDEPIRPDDKDCKLAMHRAWLVEVSELDATTRKRDLAELRAFISRRVDHIRAPFGRLDEVYPRQFLFVGTTNDMGVIKEDDGRRYWPIEVTEFDLKACRQQREQLWAEAMHAYQEGERWWLSSAMERKRRLDNVRFTEEDVLSSTLSEMLEAKPIPPDGLELNTVTAWLRDRGISAVAARIPAALRRAGLEVRPWGRKRVNRWFWPESEE